MPLLANRQVEHTAQLLVDLGIADPANQGRSGKLEEIFVLGPSSSDFCMIASTLVNELLGKSIPTRRGVDVTQLQFLSAVLRPIKQSNMFPQFDDPEFFVAAVCSADSINRNRATGARTVFSAATDDLNATSGPADGSTIVDKESAWVSRFLIVDGLAREVTANRLLEYSRLHRMQKAHASSSSKPPEGDAAFKTGGGRGSVRRAVNILQDTCTLITATSSPSASLVPGPDATVQSLKNALTAVAASVAPVKLQPVLDDPSSIDDRTMEKLRLLFDLELENYTLRRRALITRLEATLATFCEAKEAKLEKQALRLLCDECIAGLCPNPKLTIQHVLQCPKLAVLGAFQKISWAFSSRMSFPLRSLVIQKVPDRGGRVNTFGFDSRVAVAVSNANRDHAAKYSRGQRGGGGGGGASVAAAADASQAAAPSRNTHVDPGSVRGRGGRWSGDSQGPSNGPRNRTFDSFSPK